MLKRLLIIGFILAVAGNSLAAVSPHMEGEGGCSMTCCRAAHEGGQQTLLSRICCKFGCKQPAGNHSAPSTNLFSETRHKASPIAQFAFTPELALYIRQTRFPTSPTRSIVGSSTRFLETGSLLI